LVGGVAEGVGVGEDGVNLPAHTAGACDPHFVLGGEAAGGVDLFLGKQASVGEARDFGVHGVAGLDFDTEVVDLSGGSVIAKLA
jgi:hypothetical protein